MEILSYTLSYTDFHASGTCSNHSKSMNSVTPVTWFPLYYNLVLFCVVAVFFSSSSFCICTYMFNIIGLCFGDTCARKLQNVPRQQWGRTVAVVTVDTNYWRQLAFLRIRPNTPEHNHRVWIVTWEAKFSCRSRDITCRSLPFFARIKAFCMFSFSVFFILRIYRCVPSDIR